MDTNLKTKWDIIPVSGLTNPKERKIAYRLNCLGSAYYFINIGLGKNRMYAPLHTIIADILEQEHLKELIEWPRGHFKTTIITEGGSIWWALPFSDQDEGYMRRLGYGDEWIAWMKLAHNRNTKNLIVSENDENVAKIGRRFDNTYKNNINFRWLFPEIIPDSSCNWGANSKTHKRTVTAVDGEGTFDFMSVGMALQSRHYDKIIQDDLVGIKARDSEVVMKSTIEYHRILLGASESSERLKTSEIDEIVVGNRWSYSDLNSYIREEEPWFNVHSHSALGGCCDIHPVGVPIFPLEYSVEKLQKYAKRFGLYNYSCHYLNDPIAPGVALFDPSWLRYYNLVKFNPTLDYQGNPVDRRAAIHHEVKSGEAIKDILVQELPLFMIVDPNHAGNAGRCRHAITVTAVSHLQLKNGTKDVKAPQRIYVIEAWAESCNYHEFVRKIYEFADKYKLNRFWLETVGGQRYLKFYLDERNKVEKRRLRVEPLKIDTSANAKRKRIDALNPYFAEGQVFIRRDAQDNFIQEYSHYPNGKTIDILDTLSYGPQVWDGRLSTKDEVDMFMTRQMNNNPWEQANYAGY